MSSVAFEIHTNSPWRWEGGNFRLISQLCRS